MRILRIDTWDGQSGGAQDYVRTVTAELNRRGHSTRVINVVSERYDAPSDETSEIRAPTSRARRLGFDIVDAPALRAEFDSTVREFRPDLVQLHHFDAGFSTVAKLLRSTQLPVLVTAHDAELVCPISTLVRPGNVICEGGVLPRCLFTGCHVGFGGPYNLWQRRLFDQWVAPKVRAYLCPSHSIAGYLHENGYRPAIHLPSFAAIPAEVLGGSPAPAPQGVPAVVGYLGRLEPYKGVHDLIDALALLPERHRTARLSIAGEGPFREALERRAETRGVEDRVEFLGRVTGAAKEAWFRRISIAAAPSNFWENFPLVALEALARSRPVVGTNIGGIPDIVQDGETGRLVPIARPDLLALALTELLDDPGRARALGEEGRRRVLREFTPERHVVRLLATYAAVLAGRPLSSLTEAEELVAAS